MKLVFDPDFDAGAWPGPLRGRPACTGEAWVGELGLLDRLETALGLTGLYPSASERVAALVRRVQETSGFWSESAKVDPFGTARKLLSWRDRLFLAGWRGQPLGGFTRVNELARATAEARPGIPDRLRAVCDSLTKRSLDVELVETYQPLESMAPLWREVFSHLEKRGVRVEIHQVEPAPPSDLDLRRASSSSFSARADGSLQLLTSDGPLEAAEEVAAWLASPEPRETVVIGAEPVLDWALRRHGLPTTGAAGPPEDNVLLQILPLVLALGWSPADPERVLELLTLPHGPVPPSVARRLARALVEWPAVGSDLWNETLSEALERIPDEGDRRNLAQRLSHLFEGNVPASSGKYGVSEVRERLALLRRWLRGRIERVADLERGAWDQAEKQLGLFGDQVELCGLGEFPAGQLRRLVEQATAEVGGVEVHEAQAGLSAIGQPGGIVGPVRRIVWWSFTRDTVRLQRPLPFSSAERAILSRAGVELPDPTREAISRATQWRRPLLTAAETLILVSPRRAQSGEQAFPHPLWDEIAAASRDSVRLLERSTIAAPPSLVRVTRELKPVVTSTRAWRAPKDRIEPRELESPSGAESLLGCSLQWVLRYSAGLRGGLSGALPSMEALIGKMTHEILARVLQEDCPPDRSEKRAHDLFETLGPRLAATLFLPGAEADRAAVRLAASRSARVLTQLLADRRATVASVESSYRLPAFGTTLDGRPDLVLNRPLSVIDLKWRGRGYHRDRLASGTPLQLAAYSFLVRQGSGSFPPAAYFILSRQELLSTDASAFAGALHIDGPGPAEVWAAVESTYSERWHEVKAGNLEAPGNPDQAGLVPPKSFLEGTSLTLVAPCGFCDFRGLCGLAYVGERS